MATFWAVDTIFERITRKVKKMKEKSYGKLLNTKEVAELLGISEACVRKWRVDKRGPIYIRLGKSKGCDVRYWLTDVMDWIDDCNANLTKRV